MTRVKRSSIIVGSSRTALSNHRNHNTSLSCSAIETIKKAFLISAVRGILYNLNRSKISSIFWLNLGPEYRQSLGDGPVDSTDVSDDSDFGYPLISSYYSMVWQVLQLLSTLAVTRLHNVYNSLVNLVSYDLVILVKNCWSLLCRPSSLLAASW